MKTFIQTLLPLVLCMTVLSACTDDYGEVETRTFKLTNEYTTLDISSAFDVVMSDAVSEPTVTLPEMLFNKLTFKVTNKTLKIGLRTLARENIQEAQIKLPQNSNLHVIDADGACKMIISSVPDMQSISLSGASQLDVSGNADVLKINISGASTLHASELAAGTIKGEISGASEADVSVCEELNVKVSGASFLTYGTSGSECNPTVKCPATGGSTVSKR